MNSVGGPLTVKVTVTEDRIDSIEIAECADTRGVGDAAIDRLIPMMIENQSTNVDGVSGATLTSVFLKNAVNAALQAAGAGYAMGGSAAAGASGVLIAPPFEEEGAAAVLETLLQQGLIGR